VLRATLSVQEIGTKLYRRRLFDADFEESREGRCQSATAHRVRRYLMSFLLLSVGEVSVLEMRSFATRADCHYVCLIHVCGSDTVALFKHVTASFVYALCS